jgi:hypothetical protein
VTLFNHYKVEKFVELPNGNYVQRVASVAAPIASLDIAKIIVLNCPFDPEGGRAVRDAYTRVTVFDYRSHETIVEFEHPRWSAGRQISGPNHRRRDRAE